MLLFVYFFSLFSLFSLPASRKIFENTLSIQTCTRVDFFTNVNIALVR